MVYPLLPPSGTAGSPVAFPMYKWNQSMVRVAGLAPDPRATAAGDIQTNWLKYLTGLGPAFRLSANDRTTLRTLQSRLYPGNRQYRTWIAFIAGLLAAGTAPVLTYWMQGGVHWVEARDPSSPNGQPVTVTLPARGAGVRTAPPSRPVPAIGNPYTALASSPAPFTISYETALGLSGQAMAREVRAGCERNYRLLCRYFGMRENYSPAVAATRTTAPGRIDIYIDQGNFGAFHESAHGTEIHCSTVLGLEPGVMPMLMVAELIEVFAANKRNGWNSRKSNGEALSRALAGALFPDTFRAFLTGAYWLNNPARPDFITAPVTDDSDLEAVGCGVLFLNHLHWQLGYDWDEIIRAGGNNLGETYQTLTALPAAMGFRDFNTLLARRFPLGWSVLLRSDNPFPL